MSGEGLSPSADVRDKNKRKTLNCNVRTLFNTVMGLTGIIVCLLTVIISCEGREVKLLNGTKGGSITLPDPVMENGYISIEDIVIIVVKEKKSDIYDEIFKDKVLWNNKTGLFTITGLQRNDSGIYQINPKKGKDFIIRYNLTVYDPVSSPAVKAVNVSADSCMLLCSVDRAEDTTLLWYKGQEVVKQSRAALSLNLTIHLQDFSFSYRCVAVNPAEEKTSPVHHETVCRAEQDKTGPTTRTYVAGIIIPIVLVVIVLVVVFFIKWKYFDKNKKTSGHLQEAANRDEVVYTDVHIADNRCSQGQRPSDTPASVDRCNLTTIYDKLEVHRCDPIHDQSMNYTET